MICIADGRLDIVVWVDEFVIVVPRFYLLPIAMLFCGRGCVQDLTSCCEGLCHCRGLSALLRLEELLL